MDDGWLRDDAVTPWGTRQDLLSLLLELTHDMSAEELHEMTGWPMAKCRTAWTRVRQAADPNRDEASRVARAALHVEQGRD